MNFTSNNNINTITITSNLKLQDYYILKDIKSGKLSPRCSCDKDETKRDCPNTFKANEKDPDICYDLWNVFSIEFKKIKSILNATEIETHKLKTNKLCLKGECKQSWSEVGGISEGVGVSVDKIEWNMVPSDEKKTIISKTCAFGVNGGRCSNSGSYVVSYKYVYLVAACGGNIETSAYWCDASASLTNSNRYSVSVSTGGWTNGGGNPGRL